MLTREAANNRFQLGVFSQIVADLDDATMFVPGAGHGHRPIWILGHLAICAEMGQQMLGGSLQHPEWMPLFGPGSSGEVPPEQAPSRELLVTSIAEGYARLQEMALSEDCRQYLSNDHGFAPFADSPIRDVGDIVALLLTNHFGFHLAQLSSCRREAGFPPLF